MKFAWILFSLLNSASVSVFGIILSASFCGVLTTRRDRRIFLGGMAFLLITQGAAYYFAGNEFLVRFYPLLVHFPLLCLLRFITGKWMWPTISILSAYLFCQIRRWPALLFAAILPGKEAIQTFVELAVTVPLLLIFLRISPAIRQLMYYPPKYQRQFVLLPAVYYCFDYVTRIYTKLLSSGAPVVVEFMPTICSGVYLFFLLYNFAEERKRSLSQQIQNNLNFQVAQATDEISRLRESQAQAIRYRHDLRHHLQYLLSCIENEQTKRAKDYISELCAEIEAQRVECYYENEAVNLIISSFVKRVEGTGIEIDVRGVLPAMLKIGDSDLCVILSNALENAIHACLPLVAAKTACTIVLEFRFNEQNGRLFLQIINPCQNDIRFEKGIPVSSRPGHGIGVQSICAVVERYDGGCTFKVENGHFILQLFL